MALNRRHGAAAVVVAVDDAAADVASGEEFVLYFFPFSNLANSIFHFYCKNDLITFFKPLVGLWQGSSRW